MIGWLIAAGILLLIGLMPLGAEAEYSADGYWVRLIIGPFRKRLLPAEEKQKKEKHEKKKTTVKKSKADGSATDKKKKKGGTVEFVMGLIREALIALGRFKRRLIIKNLTVRYTAASSDPYSAAMQFGGSWAGFGTLMAIIRRNFHVKRLEFGSDVDFDSKKPTVYLAADLRIAVWAVLGIGIRFGIQFLKVVAKQKINAPKPAQDTTIQGKVETANG